MKLWIYGLISRVRANTVTLQDLAMWTVDLDTGVVIVPSIGKRYEAEDAEISGHATITNCEHCISKRAVHRIDPSSYVTFKEINGTGDAQWVSLHYTTNQSAAGEAYICINDETNQGRSPITIAAQDFIIPFRYVWISRLDLWILSNSDVLVPKVRPPGFFQCTSA